MLTNFRNTVRPSSVPSAAERYDFVRLATKISAPCATGSASVPQLRG